MSSSTLQKTPLASSVENWAQSPTFTAAGASPSASHNQTNLVTVLQCLKVVRFSDDHSSKHFGQIASNMAIPNPKMGIRKNRDQSLHMAIYGHMAIGPYATNMGKWGIPGKSYKNVAQQC